MSTGEIVGVVVVSTLLVAATGTIIYLLVRNPTAQPVAPPALVGSPYGAPMTFRPAVARTDARSRTTGGGKTDYVSTEVGTAVGAAAGTAIGGPIGTAIGGALGGAFAGLV